jgi:hypothetical protein
VLSHVEPVHLFPSPALIVRVYQLVRQHVFHRRSIVYLIVAHHHPIGRSKPSDDALVARLHAEKSRVDRAPSLGELLQHESHDGRRASRHVVQLSLASLGRHDARCARARDDDGEPAG